MEDLGMKILIIGNLGYVGAELIKHLNEQGKYEIFGIDTGYFAHCVTTSNISPEIGIMGQYYKDVRELVDLDFNGFEAVVYLAAISNDPMGREFEKATIEINQNGAFRAASLAAKQGVKNFVFASSCSIYGISNNKLKETSEMIPLTSYARTKIEAENVLKSLASENFKVTCLRFGTACGFSSRLRLDLVLNDFVASAITTGKIEILSDGSPMRPLIHVTDMALSIEWALERKNKKSFLAVNTGSENWNYKIIDLANAVREIIPGIKIKTNKNANPDRRSYKVDFSLYREMAPNHQPRISLENAVNGLKEGLKNFNFKDKDFRNSKNLIRLNTLRDHIKYERLDEELFWKNLSQRI